MVKMSLNPCIQIDASFSGCTGNKLLLALAQLYSKLHSTELSKILHEVTNKINATFTKTTTLVSDSSKKATSIKGLADETKYSCSQQTNFKLIPINPDLLASGFQILFSGIEKQVSVKTMQDKIQAFSANSPISKAILKISLDMMSTMKQLSEAIREEVVGLENLQTVIDLFAVASLLDKLNPKHITILPILVGSGERRMKNTTIPILTPLMQKVLEVSRLKIRTVFDFQNSSTVVGVILLEAIRSYFSSCEVMQITATVTSYENYDQRVVTSGNDVTAINSTSYHKLDLLLCQIGECTSSPSSMVILESSLDDVTGEHLGRLVQVLSENNISNISYSPIFMKKNRPGWELKLICTTRQISKIAYIIMKYTGTLGIRVIPVAKHIKAQSSIKRINFMENEISVKETEFSTKLEFEDLIKIEKKTGLTPLQVEKQIGNLKE